jgi:hypothetical protein
MTKWGIFALLHVLGLGHEEAAAGQQEQPRNSHGASNEQVIEESFYIQEQQVLARTV